MSNTQGDLASLSRFIFRAPSWYSSVAFSLLIAALAGVAAFDSRFVLEDAWQGVFFIGVPTVVASVVTPYLDRLVGGQLTPNRASLLALLCELVVVGVLTLAGLGAILSPSLGQEFVFEALVAALASIFALRLLVVMAVSRDRLGAAIVPASVQTVAAAVLLFVYSGTMTYFEVGGPILRSYLSRPERAPPELTAVGPELFVLLAITCVLYVGAVYVFLLVIDRPWRNSMGVSVLDFIRGFVGHIAEGTRELEDFFEQLGEDAIVPVSVLSFRTSAGEKARFVLPMIHPGPMGEIGGGNLPERIAASAEGLAFPPHATAGHDFNLVTGREVDTVLAAADRALSHIQYDAEATRSERVEAGEAKLLGQAFGDSAFLASTFSPGFADDVDYAVGLSATAEARTGGLRDVMLADAHNCNNGLEGDDLGHVVPGSKRSFDMIESAGALGERLGVADRHPVSLGVAWDETPWEPIEGVGPLGIRVALFEVDGQQTAYVLVDGNNMEPGLRDRLVETLVDGAIDEAEVLTTDTHTVNTVEAENQVGDAIDHDELETLVRRLVDEAAADLEPVEAGMATERTEVRVFGNDRTESLASHANAMLSMGGALAGAFILAVTAVSVLIFFLT
jgi:putative membrane protein